MSQVIDGLTDLLATHDPGGVRAVYLYGSAAAGGLRPDSDFDLLVLTERSWSRQEREGVVDFLLRHSGRRATAAPGRPLELTSLVISDVVPWGYPPIRDFQYGEWLRDEVIEGHLPERQVDPNLTVLLTTVQQHAVCLTGPHPSALLAPVPAEDLRRSVYDGLDPLLGDLDGDERNVLLTLARMLCTLDTGQIAAKDEAGRQVMSALPEPHREALSVAVDGYLGTSRDDWSQRREQARASATHLAERIRAAFDNPQRC